MRMDDKVTTVTLSNVIINGVNVPPEGSTLTYTGLETIGMQFDCDHRGYAILHTARPIFQQAKPVQLKVDTITYGTLMGWPSAEIVAKYITQ